MSEQSPPERTASPSVSASQPAPQNRRAFQRRRPRGKLKVLCYKGTHDLGENLALSVADVSESGVRLHVKIELPKGQDVLLLLEGREHTRPLKTAGRVVWCRPLPEENKFHIGVQLTNYLHYRDLLKMT